MKKKNLPSEPPSRTSKEHKIQEVKTEDKWEEKLSVEDRELLFQARGTGYLPISAASRPGIVGAMARWHLI